MNKPNTPEQPKSEFFLTPEEAARVEAGHREMKQAEATEQPPTAKPAKQP